MIELTYNLDTKALVEQFSRKGAICAIKDGDYNPETEQLRISFKDEEVNRIATAQLELIKRDLDIDPDSTCCDDEIYFSALEFVRTKEFVSCCQIATGVSFEEANEFGEYLARRYSPEYKKALNDCFLLVKPDFDDLNSTEFAFELAVFLFEKRNHDSRNLVFEFGNDHLIKLASFGVNVEVVRRQYIHLKDTLYSRLY